MGALEVSKGTVKSIYALGAKLGMVESGGGHEDALHMLVQGLTGKESVKELTPAEAATVLAELRRRLEKYDPAPAGVQLRDRLCGLIERQFRVTSFPTQPFRFLTFDQGNALIEGLKKLTERKELKYLHSAKYRRDQEAARNAE